MYTLLAVATLEKIKQLKKIIDAGVTDKPHNRMLYTEGISWREIENICTQSKVKFKFQDINNFLQETSPDDKTIILVGDTAVEPMLYNNIWEGKFSVDGKDLNKILNDKYHLYKKLGNLSIRQPKTAVVSSYRDLESALSFITSEKIVMKPRFLTFESKNVLIMNRSRIENAKPGEYFNFSDCIMQEYISDSIWPPQEWRFHFVGWDICRCIKITDKNNWNHALKIEDLSTQDVPEQLIKSQKVNHHFSGET